MPITVYIKFDDSKANLSSDHFSIQSNAILDRPTNFYLEHSQFNKTNIPKKKAKCTEVGPTLGSHVVVYVQCLHFMGKPNAAQN